MTLRNYQIEFNTNVREAWARGQTRVIGTLPVGAGKSVCARDLVEEVVTEGKPALLIAHRDELIRQLYQHILKAGIDKSLVGVVKSGYPLELEKPVQVASIQSLVRRRQKPEAVRIIIDEAHRSASSTYQNVLACYPDAQVLGLTATPARTDGKGLKDVGYQKLVLGPSMRELIQWGYLRNYKVYGRQAPDLSKVRTRMGEYEAQGCREEMAKLTGDAVEAWLEHANGVRTVVFAVDRQHGQSVAREYQWRGINAGYVDGEFKTSERREIVRNFICGNIPVLVNVGLIDEGFDALTLAEMEGIDADANIGCVQFLRPTKSLIKYQQMAGRALRPGGGLEYSILLDHAGVIEEHGFPDDPHIWTLDGVKKRRRRDVEEEEAQRERKKRAKPVHDRNGELVLLDPEDKVYRFTLYWQQVTDGKLRANAAVARWVKEFDPSFEEIEEVRKLFLGYLPTWSFNTWKNAGGVFESWTHAKEVAKTVGWTPQYIVRVYMQECNKLGVTPEPVAVRFLNGIQRYAKR